MLFVGIVHIVPVARLSRSDEADAVRISAASAFSLGLLWPNAGLHHHLSRANGGGGPIIVQM